MVIYNQAEIADLGRETTMTRMTSRALLHWALVAGILMTPLARAEEDCAGPIYANPSCSAACPLEDCQDVSFGQDGSQYQCCPPATASVPELPGGMGPLTLVFLFLGLSGLLWLWRRRRMPRT